MSSFLKHNVGQKFRSGMKQMLINNNGGLIFSPEETLTGRAMWKIEVCIVLLDLVQCWGKEEANAWSVSFLLLSLIQ